MYLKIHGGTAQIGGNIIELGTKTKQTALNGSGSGKNLLYEKMRNKEAVKNKE